MTTRRPFSIAARAVSSAVFAAVLMVGCGGGGGSSAGGGSASGTATSTIVLQLSNSTVAAFVEPRGQSGGWRSIIETASDMLIPTAFAQTGDIEVFLDGVSVGFVDDGGTIMFPATAGSHEVTLSDGTLSHSFSVDVPSDTIVTISDVSLDANQVSFGETTVDDGTSDQGVKQTICHKGTNTISVGAPAVPAHLAHGDTEGPCVPATADESGDIDDQVAQDGTNQDSGPGNGNGNGNNGNGNGNGNGNNGNGNNRS